MNSSIETHKSWQIFSCSWVGHLLDVRIFLVTLSYHQTNVRNWSYQNFKAFYEKKVICSFLFFLSHHHVRCTSIPLLGKLDSATFSCPCSSPMEAKSSKQTVLRHLKKLSLWEGNLSWVAEIKNDMLLPNPFSIKTIKAIQPNNQILHWNYLSWCK